MKMACIPGMIRSLDTSRQEQDVLKSIDRHSVFAETRETLIAMGLSAYHTRGSIVEAEAGAARFQLRLKFVPHEGGEPGLETSNMVPQACDSISARMDHCDPKGSVSGKIFETLQPSESL
jgi:hypothetical protein